VRLLSWKVSRGVVLPGSVRVMVFLLCCLRAIFIKLSGLFNTVKYSLASTSRSPLFNSLKLERKTFPPMLMDTVQPPEAPTMIWYLVSPKEMNFSFAYNRENALQSDY